MMPLARSSSSSTPGSSQHPPPPPLPPRIKRKRVGNPDPDATVIALSPGTLMDSKRFICEICSKGFSRQQNLQMHYKSHSRPWKLETEKVKQTYVCPDEECVHHHPSRGLCDLSAIKKHFSRKHGERNWKCKSCPKAYAVQSDLKAHEKVCGTTTYTCCHCEATFSRTDSFASHKKICDEIAAKEAVNPPQGSSSYHLPLHLFLQNQPGNTINYPPIPTFQNPLPIPPTLYQDTVLPHHIPPFTPLPQHIPPFTPLPHQIPSFLPLHQQPQQNFNSIDNHLQNYTEATFNPVTNMLSTYFPSDAFSGGDFPPFQPDHNIPEAAFYVSGGTAGDAGGSLDNLTGLPPLPESLEKSSLLNEDSNLNFMGELPSWPGATSDVIGGTVPDGAGSLDNLTGSPPVPESWGISALLDDDSNLNFMGQFPSWPH